MKRITVTAPALLVSLVALCASATARAPAQDVPGEKCDGPVYKAGEVSKRASLVSRPEPGFTDEARANNVRGRVVLAGVLCRSGRVTELRVVEGLPHGMTEQALEAARRIKFTPAEKDGQPVSQFIRIEYYFNEFSDGPGDKCVGARCAGMPVEELQVEGNRRLTDEDIFSHVRTRPGDAYDEEQVRRDLKALLDLQVFDTAQTTVSTTLGARGGVVVTFTVKELPIIRDLTFEGLKSVTEAEVLKAFREGGVGVGKELPFDPAKVRRARSLLRRLLAGRGSPDATVDVSVSDLSTVSVTLAFVVNERPRGTKSF